MEMAMNTEGHWEGEEAYLSTDGFETMITPMVFRCFA
jgi:hypothetical protein